MLKQYGLGDKITGQDAVELGTVVTELEVVLEDGVVGKGVVEAVGGGTGVDVPEVVVELEIFGPSAAVNRLISAFPFSIHSLFTSKSFANK